MAIAEGVADGNCGGGSWEAQQAVSQRCEVLASEQLERAGRGAEARQTQDSLLRVTWPREVTQAYSQRRRGNMGEDTGWC